jgi:hypothetical protein
MGSARILFTLYAIVHCGRCAFYHFEDQELTSLPADIPRDAEKIHMDRNKLTAIHKEDFNDKYPYLYGLFLNDNPISHNFIERLFW